MPKATRTPSTSALKPKRIVIPSAESNAITPAEVAGWFRDAGPRWTAPDADSRAFRLFVWILNEMRRTASVRFDPDDPRLQRTRRIATAVRTLLDDLPAHEVGDVVPWAAEEREAMRLLYEAAMEAGTS